MHFARVIGTVVWIMAGSLAPVRQSLPHGTMAVPKIVRPRSEGRP